MRAWALLPFASSCGSCRKAIARGEVVLEIHPAGAGATLLRCQSCGVEMFGEAAPDLPLLSLAPQPSLPIERGHDHGFVRFDHQAVRATVAKAERDYRSRQSGGD